MGLLSDDQWRLGHKRPWWQWNVLTLFAALFVLIWMRELVAPNVTGAWVALAMFVFLAWLILPTLFLPPQASAHESVQAADESTEKSDASFAVSDARLQWMCVVMFGALLLLKLAEVLLLMGR